MKMKVMRQIFKAGETLMIRERPASKRVKGEKRAPKSNPTSEEVVKNNIRYSIFKATLVLNENFQEGDYHISLTFKEKPESEENFKKCKETFFRHLRYECKKRNINFKYFIVAHREHNHYHYHLVITRIPKEIIEKCWPYGFVFYSELWKNPNRYNLAKYLIKGAVKGMEGKNLINSKKFSTSQNIVIPEAETEELTSIDLEDDPRVFKGYLVDGEVERYEHMITRTTCRQYILVSDGSRNRRMNKKKMKPLEYINYSKLLRDSYEEEQLSFFVDEVDTINQACN